MIHTLENDQLRIKIADHGAELSEIYDKTNDRQGTLECRSCLLETPCSGSLSECRTLL